MQNIPSCPATWSQQELFDYVVAHLLEQGERSTVGSHPNQRFAYRGELGHTSAVGCLIPDGLYHFSLENKLADDLFKGEQNLSEWLGAGNMRLLCHLEDVHDFTDCNRWAARLREIAKQHGLSEAAIEHHRTTLGARS